jgi:uncharacterized protein
LDGGSRKAQFVKDPLDVVKVGDALEFRIISLDRDRRRIGLSRKTEPQREGEKPRNDSPRPKGRGMDPNANQHEKPGVKSGVTEKGESPIRRIPGSAGPKPSSAAQTSRTKLPASADNDGTMYNPFAEAFKRMGERKGKK